MPQIINDDGEQTDFAAPPMGEEEWRLLLQYANLGAYEQSIQFPNSVKVQREVTRVIQIVRRYRGGE